MQRIRAWFRNRSSFVTGFILASMLFGSVSFGAEMIEKQITVVFPDYLMKFNGVRKAPPDDQKPLLYNGRTYLPLRFVAEAMGHPVEFERETQTIYIGSRPEKRRPTVLLKPEENAAFTSWSASDNLKKGWGGNVLYLNPAADITGADRENAWIVQPWVCATFSCGYTYDIPKSVTLQKDFVLNGKYSRLTGTLFPGVIYKGSADGRNVGYLVVKDENDKVLYQSPTVRATGVNDDIHFSVDVRGVAKIKLFLVSDVFGANRREKKGWDEVYMAELGIENLGLE